MNTNTLLVFFFLSSLIFLQIISSSKAVFCTINKFTFVMKTPDNASRTCSGRFPPLGLEPGYNLRFGLGHALLRRQTVPIHLQHHFRHVHFRPVRPPGPILQSENIAKMTLDHLQCFCIQFRFGRRRDRFFPTIQIIWRGVKCRNFCGGITGEILGILAGRRRRNCVEGMWKTGSRGGGGGFGVRRGGVPYPPAQR